MNVAVRLFHIWKLEYWWVMMNDSNYYPSNRVHIKGRWFWRKRKKSK